MMKRIVSMLLLTGTLLIGNTVFAFYADEVKSSMLYLTVNPQILK